MRRALPLSLLIAVPLALAARPAAAAGSVPTVDVVKVDGVIDRAMAGYVEGTIGDAERAGSTVVLQLDTPGSLNVEAVAIARDVFTSRVPVVAPEAIAIAILRGSATSATVIPATASPMSIRQE